MKKLCIVLALLLCLMPVLSVSAEAEPHPERLIDSIGLLTADEQAALGERLDTLSERLNFDFAIVTVDSLDGKTATEYADDFYDYNGYGMNGNDGILLLICVGGEGRQYAYSVTGRGEDIFLSSDMDRLDEAFLPFLRDSDYNDAFLYFADTAAKIVSESTYNGDDPYADYDYTTDPDYGYTTGEKLRQYLFPGFGWLLLALAVGVLLAFIVMAGHKSVLKSVRAQAAANSYVVDDSMRLTMDRDLFLYRTVTSTPRNDNNRDSSSHTGSSGTSHSGRSGSF